MTINFSKFWHKVSSYGVLLNSTNIRVRKNHWAPFLGVCGPLQANAKPMLVMPNGLLIDRSPIRQIAKFMPINLGNSRHICNESVMSYRCKLAF